MAMKKLNFESEIKEAKKLTFKEKVKKAFDFKQKCTISDITIGKSGRGKILRLTVSAISAG